MTKDEILELLDELTARLEGPAEEVFALAVRSTLTSGIITLVICLVVLVVAIQVVRWARQSWVEVTSDSSINRYGKGDGYAMFGVAAAVIAIPAFVFLMMAIQQLLNVHYYALRSLVPGI